MKTKNAILVGAVVLLSAGALSNLQWSMDQYGLLGRKQVLALDDTTSPTGKKGKKWVKEFSGNTKEVQETVESTTTIKVGPVVKVEKSTYTRPKKIYENICKEGDELKSCTPSWDDSPKI